MVAATLSQRATGFIIHSAVLLLEGGCDGGGDRERQNSEGRLDNNLKGKLFSSTGVN